jgi:hypothetical protein
MDISINPRPKNLIWYRRWDSNPHSRRNTILSRARLPIPPLRHNVLNDIATMVLMMLSSVDNEHYITPRRHLSTENLH